MALLTISGEPGSRFEEVAHGASQLLQFELVTEARLAQWIAEEFGDIDVPDRAWRAAVASILARMAREHHLVVATAGAESLFPALPYILRVGIVAPETRRVGNVMLDQRLERPQAKKELARLNAEAKQVRKRRFGRPSPGTFDVVLNGEQMDPAQMAEILRAAAGARCLAEQGLLAAEAEAELQFKTRLELARHGISPAGRAHLRKVAFGHPSEEMFANLLDFYRIQWAYEPRSFPLQWDKDGHVTEAFTPDFYLPEFDLYVELTTMKQALVTKKNRKVKLLRAVYPHVNIQVFYQKDFQELVLKYGLKMRS
jgi:cytidylate kinase